MAEIIHLESKPAQFFPVRFGDTELGFLFSYNQMFDSWSYSIFPEANRDLCPLIAGRLIRPEIDLIDGLGLGLEFRFFVANLPGVSRETFRNAFERFTVPFGGDPVRAGSYFLKMSFAEIEAERLGFPDFPFPRC